MTLSLHHYFTERQRSTGDVAEYGIDIEFKIVGAPGDARLFFKQARLLGAVLPEE